MRETRRYTVAGHTFTVTAETDDLAMMTNYEPFATDDETRPVLFTLSVTNGEEPDFDEETSQDDEGQQIVCGKTSDGKSVFAFSWLQQRAGWLTCDEAYREGQIITTDYCRKMAIDNALMIMFALATANLRTVLFHAAMVSYQAKAYMFLGPSGTGKSTHARLWLQHMEGSELMNDDNPVVRIGDDGKAVAYGSPWSGKTPCYRHVSLELGAIVTLSQAPYNKIRQIKGIEAFAALLPSISGKRWDSRIADGLYETENMLAGGTAMWHLECLPDEEAALLCNKTITP